MHAATAQELITGLELVRHPEGGWFRETYRSSETEPAETLPERFTGWLTNCKDITLPIIPKLTAVVADIRHIAEDFFERPELWNEDIWI